MVELVQVANASYFRKNAFACQGVMSTTMKDKDDREREREREREKYVDVLCFYPV